MNLYKKLTPLFTKFYLSIGIISVALYFFSENIAINFAISGIEILFIYPIYFFFQDIGYKKIPRELPVWKIEEKIKFNPHWVWVYTVLYYAFILSPCFLTDKVGMLPVWISGFVLILFHGLFFVYYPVKTPDHWRKSRHANIAEKILINFVQKFDRSNNCFPSMHVSVATLVSLHLGHILGRDWYIPILLSFLLISWSCLKTKQHYVVDLLPAPILGYITFKFIYVLL